MIEPIERRLLWSATVSLDVTTGTLIIVGTDHPDTIVVNGVRSHTNKPLVQLNLNGGINSYPAASVLALHVEGQGGADTVTIGAVAVPALVNGGSGNDSLTGGLGDATISGAGGNDHLVGGAGDDVLSPGLEKDSVFGGAGNDRIIPDNGKDADDTLAGGAGSDTVDYSNSTIKVNAFVGGVKIASSQENDVISNDIETIRGSRFGDKITDSTKRRLKMFGGGGPDTLVGGSGNDTLDGGSGIDDLIGNGGDDHFRAKDGEVDVLDGGSGTDIVENSDSLIVADGLTNIP